MSAKPVFDVYNCKPIFAGEIIVARKNAMDITNTKIDDLALGIVYGLPKFSREQKMDHYNKKLQLVWDSEKNKQHIKRELYKYSIRMEKI